MKNFAQEYFTEWDTERETGSKANIQLIYNLIANIQSKQLLNRIKKWMFCLNCFRQSFRGAIMVLRNLPKNWVTGCARFGIRKRCVLSGQT